jgi:hypothetical protein
VQNRRQEIDDFEFGALIRRRIEQVESTDGRVRHVAQIDLLREPQRPGSRYSLGKIAVRRSAAHLAALRAQANRNKWAAAFAATSAVLIAIAEFFFQA